MRMKKIFYILTMLSLTLTMYAQDARLSHSFLWKSYYNPAYSAMEDMVEVDAGVQSTYTQRHTLFLNQQLAATFPFKIKNSEWGGGLKAYNERQGGGLYSETCVSIPVALRLQVHEDTYIQFGFEPCVYNNRLDKDKMVFGDQLDHYYGLVSGTSTAVDGINTESVWAADLSLGIFGRTIVGRNGYIKPIYLEYGISAFHTLGTNSKSFFNKGANGLFNKNLYYRRFCGQVEYLQPFGGKPLYFSAYGIFQHQAGMNDLQVGSYFTHHEFGFLGFGFKLEKYKSVAFENFMIHLGWTHILNHSILMNLAYTYEMPVTQGNVLETSVHSISLHFYIDSERKKGKFKCKWPSKIKSLTRW